jgi:VIT1/CCC1 family predicted Fe2+/Mn2+ transporter
MFIQIVLAILSLMFVLSFIAKLIGGNSIPALHMLCTSISVISFLWSIGIFG